MEPKHSGLGIASFVLSILGGLGLFALIVVAGVLEASTPGGMDEKSPQAIVVGLGIIGGGCLELLALVLGIASLFQSNRQKIFGILGTAIAFAAAVGTGRALMAIGLMMPD